MLAIAKVQEELDSMLELQDSDELTPEQKAQLTVYVQQLLQQKAEKADGLAQYFRLAAAEAEAYEEEGKRLIDKGKAVKKRIDYMKQAASSFMQAFGIKKIKGNAYTISLRKSEGVDVFDMDALQKDAGQFVKTKIEYAPDKIAIKEAIKSGESVPGARLVERECLQVR